jgi:transmembrane sensor
MIKPVLPEDDMQRAREQALDWFTRRRSDTFTDAEENLFQAWLKAASVNAQAYAEREAQWQAFDEIPQETRDLLRRNLAYDQAMRAASPAGASSDTRHDPTRRRGMVAALTAAVATVVVGGTGVIAWNYRHPRPLFAENFQTQRGQQTEAGLPDGSHLWLDTATHLEVAYYEDSREVRLLDGQAVFSVHGDAARPFHVLAGDARITVVGTRFSVRHTPGVPGDADVRVEVEEGKVKVEGKQVVLLTAGQQASSDGKGQISAITPVLAEGIAPWREHRVSFDNARLDRVLSELGRYGNVPLIIRDPAVAGLKLTGVFDPRDLGTFQRVLPLSLPLRLKDNGDGTAELALRR